MSLKAKITNIQKAKNKAILKSIKEGNHDRASVIKPYVEELKELLVKGKNT